MTIDLTSHLKTCRRSHPHEEMDDVCERYTEYERELAALREELSLTTGTLESRERNIETLKETIADMEVRHAAVMLHAQTHADEYNALRAECDKWKGQIKEWQEANIQLGQRAERAEAAYADLMADREKSHQRWNEENAARMRAEAERDAALKDAERYRHILPHLRLDQTGRKVYRKCTPRWETTLTSQQPDHMTFEMPPLADEYEIRGACIIGKYETVTDAIDAAIAARKGEQ